MNDNHGNANTAVDRAYSWTSYAKTAVCHTSDLAAICDVININYVNATGLRGQLCDAVSQRRFIFGKIVPWR